MKIVLIILLLFITSCVSLKTAKNINKAENKIILFDKGINNQIEKYPELVTDAFTMIVYDTIQIASDSLQVNLILQDTKSLDSINNELIDNTSKSFNKVDSIVNIVIKDNPVTKLQLTKIKKIVKEYKIKSDTLFQKYTELSYLENIEGIYENYKFIIPYTIKNGVLQMNVKTKEGFIVIEKSITTNKINIRKNFWQDKKFWFLFVVPIIALVYLLGSKIQGLMQFIVKLIRKLITGGI